jgi:hypothetical protein
MWHLHLAEILIFHKISPWIDPENFSGKFLQRKFGCAGSSGGAFLRLPAAAGQKCAGQRRALPHASPSMLLLLLLLACCPSVAVPRVSTCRFHTLQRTSARLHLSTSSSAYFPANLFVFTPDCLKPLDPPLLQSFSCQRKSRQRRVCATSSACWRKTRSSLPTCARSSKQRRKA